MRNIVIDFHNHLVPSADDGAADIEQARSALVTLLEQGVHTVVTTPHLQGSLTGRPDALDARLTEIDGAWERLRAMAHEEFTQVRLHRGAEVMLDTLTPDLTDPRTRLAGTSFALVEFPHMAIPPNVDQALFHMKLRGWTPVIAHPERYGNMRMHLESVEHWKGMGAYLQVNAGSLLGRYGPAARDLAWMFIEDGAVEYLCSDYHARGRVALTGAREALTARGGAAQAELLLEANAARLLAGEPPLEVPPLRRPRPLWKRILGGMA